MTAGRTTASLSQNWCTPPKYVQTVRQFFGGVIDLDPCSNSHSIVSAKTEYRLPKQDGLRLSWDFRSIYVNPPYGSDKERGTTIKHWLCRCSEANLHHGSEVLALVPVATNTTHWKQYVWGSASAVAFLYDTRLKFLVDGQDGGKGAPMSCAMVYWGERTTEFDREFSEFGAIVDLTPLKGRRFGRHLKPQEEPSLFAIREPKSKYSAKKVRRTALR